MTAVPYVLGWGLDGFGGGVVYSYGPKARLCQTLEKNTTIIQCIMSIHW